MVLQICRHIFGTVVIDDPEAWEALGPEFHSGLEKNYITWASQEVLMPISFRKEDLHGACEKDYWSISAGGVVL